MKRVYHHYENLEEYRAGMWRFVSAPDRAEYVRQAADLMRSPETFKEAMLRAVEEWPYSCEHNLTASAVNKIAWLGHAGCCIAVRSPEDLTRLAWHTLTPEEQDEANRVAAEALDAWRAIYAGRR